MVKVVIKRKHTTFAAKPWKKRFSEDSTTLNALAELLDLSSEQKMERGLLHTPAEIAQQPATWQATFASFERHHAALVEFLSRAGFGDSARPKPTVFLIGAGSSDYVGRSLAHLL